MMYLIIPIAFVGIVVSLYGIFVERKLQQNPHYKAACDISEKISCTRPMTSSYANIFGISNSAASALYYLSVIVIACVGNLYILRIMTGIGLIVTICFAYILYFKIKSFCLICNTLYVINIVLFSICYFFP